MVKKRKFRFKDFKHRTMEAMMKKGYVPMGLIKGRSRYGVVEYLRPYLAEQLRRYD